MLERGGVKDDVGFDLREEARHPGAVPNVEQDQRVRVEERSTFERQLHPVEAGLVSIHHDQSSGRERRELPAELGADRAARPGDEHRLSADVVRHALEIGLDLVTPEQVGFGGLAQVSDVHFATEEFTNRRHDSDREPGGTGLFREITNQGTVASRDGHHQGLRPELGGDLGDVAAITQDPDASDGEVALAGVIVEERDRDERAIGVEQHCADRALATVTGTEDDRSLAVTVHRATLLLQHLAGDVARTTHSDEGHDARTDDGAHRSRSVTGKSEVDGDEGEAGDGRRAGQRSHLLKGSVDPPPSIEAGPVTRGGLEQDRRHEKNGEVERIDSTNVEVEAQQRRKIERDYPNETVGAHARETLARPQFFHWRSQNSRN